MDTLTIRPATQADAVALHRLAALDSASPPTGETLVAEVGGELWAALDLDTGVAIADPFRPSGELVGLLRFHAARTDERPRSASPGGACCRARGLATHRRARRPRRAAGARHDTSSETPTGSRGRRAPP